MDPEREETGGKELERRNGKWRRERERGAGANHSTYYYPLSKRGGMRSALSPSSSLLLSPSDPPRSFRSHPPKLSL